MFIVAALYHFSRFPDPVSLREPLQLLCNQLGIKGSLLIASEGVNGTVAGSRDAIDQVLIALRARMLRAGA
jgi:UPF0176 protein